MKITPLQDWIAARMGTHGHCLSRVDIERRQLPGLRETVRRASAGSRFYSARLGKLSEADLHSLEDLHRFPFTTARDLRRNPYSFLCASQGNISRVVTLGTSGTSGQPKRVFFTAEDLESTIDFFRQGMSILAKRGDRVLILLPGERPGSVGDLLREALRRIGAEGIVHGPVNDVPGTLERMAREHIGVLVGTPTQVLSLGRQSDGKSAPRSILLSTDHVPKAIVEALRHIWNCEVFTHYGMTEMGYGGGVECSAHRGYHMREADLCFEIVHPETGRPVPDGVTGEVVFTTLTRMGMPLIRYRTGDLGRFLPDACPCGTVLKTMDRIEGRIDGRVPIAGGSVLTIAELDEALFPMEGLLDFEASISREDNRDRLHIELSLRDAGNRRAPDRALDALRTVPAIRLAELRGDLVVTLAQRPHALPATGSTAKRTLVDNRNPERVS